MNGTDSTRNVIRLTDHGRRLDGRAEDVGATLGSTIVEAMRREALATAFCIATDATGIAVLPPPDENGRRQACKRGHFFVLIAGGRSLAGRAPPSDAIDRYLVGNSPERFLRVGVDGIVETRPIKGTRPRGRDPTSDAAARLALVASAKDRAEHVMIVDLERNDLGRVCKTGSVEVADLLGIVEFPTLFHQVSTVRGRLQTGTGLSALLQATFPGGSVTGAPKRRAMEIIEELEPVRRGVCTGATGWLGAAGDRDLAVAIRAATVDSGRLSLFVGGGIVADSDAAAEWAETEVKARAFSSLSDSDSGP